MKIILILIITVFSLQPIVAQQRVVTLESAIQTGIENNREIKVARLNVQKSRSAVREAFGYALPTVDVSANFSHFVEKPRMAFPDFEALLGNATYSILFDEGVIPRDEDKFKPVETRLQSFVQTNNYESQIQITQPLFNASVLRGIGASRIYLSLSEEELNHIISATILDVKKAFYGVLLAKEFFEITKASYENAQENLRNVKVAYEQGLVAEFDMLQAEVQVENIRPMVLKSENAYKSAKDGLKIVLGIDQDEEIDAVGEIAYEPQDVPSEEQVIPTALVDNFGVRAMKLKMDVDRAFIDYYRSEYWPVLYAFGNYAYAGSDDRYNFQNYSSAIVGVTLSFNLFTGGQTRQRVQQSKITMRQTEQQLYQLQDYITAQVKTKIQDIRRVLSIVNAQERNVSLAERAYEIAIIRYREGTGSQLEVQNADLALRQARINRLQSVYDYIIAQAELDQLVGKFDEGLFQ